MSYPPHLDLLQGDLALDLLSYRTGAAGRAS
jgi:hypothetical protein